MITDIFARRYDKVLTFDLDMARVAPSLNHSTFHRAWGGRPLGSPMAAASAALVRSEMASRYTTTLAAPSLLPAKLRLIGDAADSMGKH
jgi:hypothetical protein